MENNISLKDLIVSFRKNFIYFILIYLGLYFFAYIIERYTPYEFSSENMYLEYKVFPIQPIEEASIQDSLTFTFNDTFDLNPSRRTIQKNFFSISAERILNDFLITLYSKSLIEETIENTYLSKDLLPLIQNNVSVEIYQNPLSASVSINLKNFDKLDSSFFNLISNAALITQEKVINLINKNIDKAKNELKRRLENIKNLSNMQNEIVGYKLLLKTAEINYENLDSFDFSFVESIDFIKISLEPNKVLGLKRYSIDLTSLSILFSTIICIIILFLRSRKI